MKTRLLACLMLLGFGLPDGNAGILGFHELKIDFTKADDARKKATWSEKEKLDITERGLGWDGEVNALRSGWVQTEPLAIGLSWRPAQSANVNLKIAPDAKPFKLPNGQVSRPALGPAFVRHSPDGKHWSSWQAMDQAHKNAGDYCGYSAHVAIPRKQRTEYDRLYAEYQSLDVPWTCDEEAMANWIVKRHPDFFHQHQPFVGYVQVLFEGDFWGGQRVSRLEVSAAWGVGGVAGIPKDKNAEKDRDGPWRFKAK
jgi:hypothetical protein